MVSLVVQSGTNVGEEIVSKLHSYYRKSSNALLTTSLGSEISPLKLIAFFAFQIYHIIETFNLESSIESGY